MSTGMLRMDVDARELRRAPGVVARAWVKAGNRAVSKTARWAVTHGLRGIVQAEGIPVSRLRRRRRAAIRIKRVFGAARGTVWFGIRPVPAALAGKPRQLKKGAKAGRSFYEGSFVATMPSGHTGIFDRKGQARLPITEVMMALTKAPAVLRDVQRQIPDRLQVVLVQELNFEMRRGQQ